MDVDDLVTGAVELMDRWCGLCAAYLVGSLATGDAAGDASDVDLLLVTARRLDAGLRRRAGEELADLAARGPLRGVEAVLYRAAVLARPEHPLPYELNVNAGRAMDRSVTTGGDPAFWFLLDVAAARQHAVALLGPPAADVIGPVPDRAVLHALRDSLRWHREQGRSDADAVLTAARGWHWLHTRRWVSKTDAGRWLAGRGWNDTVQPALAARAAGVDRTLGEKGVRALHEAFAAALAETAEAGRS